MSTMQNNKKKLAPKVYVALNNWLLPFPLAKGHVSALSDLVIVDMGEKSSMQVQPREA